MAFNYNVSGLNVDIGSAIAQREKRKAYEAQQTAARTEASELRKKAAREDIQRTLAEEAMLLMQTDPNFDLSKWDKAPRLFGTNPDFYKKVSEGLGDISYNRKKLVFDSAYEAFALMTQGLDDQALQLLGERAQIGAQDPNADFSDTQRLVDNLASGKRDDAYRELEAAVAAGIATGFLPKEIANPIEWKYSAPRQDENGDWFVEGNNAYRSRTEKIKGGMSEAETLAQAKREELRVSDLPAQLQKPVDTLMTSYGNAKSAASKARDFARQYRTNIKDSGWLRDSGWIAGAERFVREVLGIETKEDLTRTNVTNLINTQIVGNLPAGVASDRDVALIKEGFPKDITNAEEMANWLEAYGNVQEAMALKNDLEAQFIEATRGRSRAKFDAEVGGYEIKAGDSLSGFLDRVGKDMQRTRDDDFLNSIGVRGMADLNTIEDDEAFKRAADILMGRLGTNTL